LLAASGAAWLQSHAGPAARAVLLTAVGLTGLAIVGALLAAKRVPFPGEQWSMTWESGWTRLVILLAALVILFRQQSVQARPGRVLFGFGLLLLMGADICTHTPRLNPTAAVQAYDELSPPMSSLPRLGQSRAMLSREAQAWMNHLANPSAFDLYLGQRTELFNDCNLLELIPKVDGFYPMYLSRQSRLAEWLDSQDYHPQLAAFLGVSQLASPGQLFHWETQTNFMPMASIGAETGLPR